MSTCARPYGSRARRLNRPMNYYTTFIQTAKNYKSICFVFIFPLPLILTCPRMIYSRVRDPINPRGRTEFKPARAHRRCKIIVFGYRCCNRSMLIPSCVRNRSALFSSLERTDAGIRQRFEMLERPIPNAFRPAALESQTTKTPIPVSSLEKQWRHLRVIENFLFPVASNLKIVRRKCTGQKVQEYSYHFYQ